MTRMQVRRNTDFTGWPSNEGQTGSQHALEGKTMIRTVNGKQYMHGSFSGINSKLYRLEIRHGFTMPVQIEVRKNSAEYKRVSLAITTGA
ncbi:TPA: hypothetical protein NH827_003883 [Pseudomonas aeruginosa]|nr:hypothetical protein [Pseudomonas aeruginosa]